MFTVYHFIWMVISAIGVAATLFYLVKHKIPLERFLSVCCVICVASELIKIFSMIEMVPSADGQTMYPYIKMQHLPLHLCSLHLFTIFYVRFAKPSKMRDTVLAFMYPTCIAGAFFAILLPSIFTSTIKPEQAFVHPLGYQFFVYHTMLIVLGAYIFLSREVAFKRSHYFSTMAILGLLGVASIYLNSMLSSPTYINGELINVDYIPNFMFTFETPIGIALTKLWHWYLYLGVLAVLAILLITVFYIPVLRSEKTKSE